MPFLVFKYELQGSISVKISQKLIEKGEANFIFVKGDKIYF